MKNWVNRPFSVRVWHVLACALAMALLGGTGVVAWAQSGSPRSPTRPQPMLRKGLIRLAAYHISGSSALTCDNNFQGVISTEVKVPAGKTADVLATANVEAYQTLGSSEYAYGEFKIDGSVLVPSADSGMWVVNGSGPSYPTISQNGMTAAAIGSGSHLLTYNLRCTAGSMSVDDTYLSGIVNIH